MGGVSLEVELGRVFITVIIGVRWLNVTLVGYICGLVQLLLWILASNTVRWAVMVI